MNTMALSVLVAIPSFALAGILVVSAIPYIFHCQIKGSEIVLKFLGILPTGRIKFRDVAEIRITPFSPEILDWGNKLFKAGKPVMFRPLGHLHGIFSKTFVIREKNGCDRAVFISSKDAEKILAAVTKACNLNPQANEQLGGSWQTPAQLVSCPIGEHDIQVDDDGQVKQSASVLPPRFALRATATRQK